MVSGNSPTSIYNGVGAANILVYQQRVILISSHGAESIAANGRCFYRGWDILVDPPTPIWTEYCTPPQPQSHVPVDPSWDILQVDNMSSAEIFYPGPSAYAGGATSEQPKAGASFIAPARNGVSPGPDRRDQSNQNAVFLDGLNHLDIFRKDSVRTQTV